mgnify:CR=1 FL=1
MLNCGNPLSLRGVGARKLLRKLSNIRTLQKADGNVIIRLRVMLAHTYIYKQKKEGGEKYNCGRREDSSNDR